MYLYFEFDEMTLLKTLNRLGYAVNQSSPKGVAVRKEPYHLTFSLEKYRSCVECEENPEITRARVEGELDEIRRAYRQERAVMKEELDRRRKDFI